MGEIPLWLMASYGFIEAILCFLFILEYSDINVSCTRLLIMASVKLLITISIRIFTNVFVIFSLNILLFILLIWVFTQVINLKVVRSILIIYLASVLIESFSMIQGVRLLQQLDYRLMWLLTGLPHVLLILIWTIVLRRVKISRASRNQVKH